MFPLKRNSCRLAVATIALSVLAALFASCARKAVTAKDAGDAEKTEGKAGANASEVDRALNEAAKKGLGDREGAVLVIDPHTGRLRAVVNSRLAFEQAFPPGSTIKPFTALTAMRAGLIDNESRTLCRGRFTSESIDVVCSHPKSETPFSLSQALAYSCNYFFATMSGRLSFDAFKATLASAGFGERTGVNASGESAGALRDHDWRVRDLLGEGDNLLVTPIQLLTAYASLVNGGHLFRPQISDDNKLVAEERATIHVDPTQRLGLIKGMRGAVVYGTAEKAGLNKLPLFIFGKTGTSAASNGFRRQGWFVSFAASANSAEEATPDSLELAVLVFLKRSHGSDAAVVSTRVFEEYAGRSVGEGKAGAGEGESGRGGENENLRVKVLSEKRVVAVPLEDYVLGVLSVEAGVEDELEALKAQAIVTRTYAIKNLGRHASEGFDLCSNTHCQQYIDPDRRASEKTRNAVGETRGAVLRDSNGQLADAYFHAACGGMTANIETLWGVAASSYLRGVRDDFCATMPNRDWTDQIPAVKLLQALRSDPRTDPGKKVDEVVVTKRDRTGRAQLISIEGDRRVRISGWEFKMIVGRALGWNLLKSSRFSVTRRGPVFSFRGRGFGHGLGLCQSGAHVMARRGASCLQILNHYFPGTNVSKDPKNNSPIPDDLGFGDFDPKAGGIKLVPSEASPQSAAVNWHPRTFVPVFNLAQTNSRLTVWSEHFRINYPAGVARGEVEAALRSLEAARVDMLARAGAASLHLPELVEVFIHETTKGFVAATGQAWWVAGVTGGRRMELQPLNVLKRRRVLNGALRHEYAHAVIESGARQRPPRWLVEGLAIAFAGEGPAFERFRPKARLRSDVLESKLAAPRSRAEMRALYAEAYLHVRWLIQKEGEARVWRRVASGWTGQGDLPALEQIAVGSSHRTGSHVRSLVCCC